MREPDAAEFDLNVDRVETHAFLQWKGTDACFDFRCDCGGGGHWDGFFAYAVRCVDCGALWEMPSILYPRKVEGDWDGCTVEVGRDLDAPV